MYRVDKAHTPAKRVNEVHVALKELRQQYTMNDLARMFYEEWKESFNGVVLDIEVNGMPANGGYAFCIDMITFDFIKFEKIHFWLDNPEEHVYEITKDMSLMERRVYTNTKNY